MCEMNLKKREDMRLLKGIVKEFLKLDHIREMQVSSRLIAEKS